MRGLEGTGWKIFVSYKISYIKIQILTLVYKGDDNEDRDRL